VSKQRIAIAALLAVLLLGMYGVPYAPPEHDECSVPDLSPHDCHETARAALTALPAIRPPITGTRVDPGVVGGLEGYGLRAVVTFTFAFGLPPVVVDLYTDSDAYWGAYAHSTAALLLLPQPVLILVWGVLCSFLMRRRVDSRHQTQQTPS